MRFSTVAATAVLFGSALAVPAQTVYETEVATITSCPPEYTKCNGGAKPTPAPYVPEGSKPEAPAYPGGGYEHDVEVPTKDYGHEVPSKGGYEHDVEVPTQGGDYDHEYPGTEHEDVEVPTKEYETPSKGGYEHDVEVPAKGGDYGVPPVMGGEYPGSYPVPTGTGSYYPGAKNTSTPYVPTPHQYQGAASTKGFSLVAVVAAAGALFLL